MRIMFALLFVFIFVLSGCGHQEKTFTIISGSENEPLEPILQDFARKNNTTIVMQYKGSVDIMAMFAEGITADAVWPANSLWLSLGDTKRVVKSSRSIMMSPVVFGIRKSKAAELGFIDKQVYVKDILMAIEKGQLKFAMTSATQSNSGASAYLGFLYALSGNPDVLRMDHLQSQELKKKIRSMLAGVNRSSGSSGWLKDLFLKSSYDAMVNYEATIIETNIELEKLGKEPLYVVYPIDGIVMSDSPLGFIDQGYPEKKEFFKKLQEYLLSEAVQKQLLASGRRTGSAFMEQKGDLSLFKTEWGVRYDIVLQPLKVPQPEVLLEALRLYQTEFRKPSYTVYCLDYSGSMSGEGETQLKQAMEMLLDQKRAAQYLLQASPDDVTVVIPFSSHVKNTWKITGNSELETRKLLKDIQDLSASGGTDIYSPVIAGLREITPNDIESYSVAIILMTDGESNTGKTYKDFELQWNNARLDIPVFSIMFAKASQDQLSDIAELTNARVFDGRKNLIEAFKKAKGYN